MATRDRSPRASSADSRGVGDQPRKGRGGPRANSGGRRPGAGRPKGSKDVLPRGAVAAIKAAGLRIPEDATPAQRQLADRALQRIADVMEEEVGSFAAFSVLTAARTLREEICGKVAEKHDHQHAVSIRLVDPFARPPEGET